MASITNNIRYGVSCSSGVGYTATVTGISGGSLTIENAFALSGARLAAITADGAYNFQAGASVVFVLTGNTGAADVTLAEYIPADARPLLPTGGATEAKQDAETTATNRAGTREYNIDAIKREPVIAASSRVTLPTLGASRELYVMATNRCFFRSGNSAVNAAAGTSHPLPADERFHLRIPGGHTHIAYIRDTADGMISIVPVA